MAFLHYKNNQTCKFLLKLCLAWKLHFHFVDAWHMSRGRHHSKEHTVERDLSKLSEK